MNSTYFIYKALLATNQRLGRDVGPLRLKFDLAFRRGRLTDEEYTELVAEITPTAMEG